MGKLRKVADARDNQSCSSPLCKRIQTNWKKAGCHGQWLTSPLQHNYQDKFFDFDYSFLKTFFIIVSVSHESPDLLKVQYKISRVRLYCRPCIPSSSLCGCSFLPGPKLNHCVTRVLFLYFQWQTVTGDFLFLQYYSPSLHRWCRWRDGNKHRAGSDGIAGRQHTLARYGPRQAHHIWPRHSGERCLNYHYTAPNYQITKAAPQPPWGPTEPDWWWWQRKRCCWWVKMHESMLFVCFCVYVCVFVMVWARDAGQFL